MKRYLNYLILFANVLIGISAAIVLGVFLYNFKYSNETINRIYAAALPTIAIPIITSIVTCGIVILFYYCLQKEVKYGKEPINPRLINGLNYQAIISLINFGIVTALIISSILIHDQTATIVLGSTAFGLAGAFTLVISGFTSYFNLRISYASMERLKLEQEATEDKQKSTHSNGTHKKELSKDQTQETHDELPTSGSF